MFGELIYIWPCKTALHLLIGAKILSDSLYPHLIQLHPIVFLVRCLCLASKALKNTQHVFESVVTRGYSKAGRINNKRHYRLLLDTLKEIAFRIFVGCRAYLQIQYFG